MEETSSERTPTMKKRRAPANDLEPSHQCLAMPPSFKRICLTHGEYRAPLEDGSHYNDASHAALTIRQLADQAIARNLHQELQAEKERIQDEFHREMEKLRAEKNELERSKNAAIAELQSTKDRLEITNRNQGTQNADLLSKLQVEKEARIRAEEERDTAVAKANEQPLQSNSSGSSTEFEPHDQTESIAAETEQLLAAVQDATTCPEENTGERNTTDDEHSKLMAENFTNKAVHERLRGQTIPPKVTPRTQITAPPVRREEPELNAIDSRLLREAPTLYAQSMRGRQRRKENRAARDAARKDKANDDNKVNTNKHVEEAAKYREERDQEYTAAQRMKPGCSVSTIVAVREMGLLKGVSSDAEVLTPSTDAMLRMLITSLRIYGTYEAQSCRVGQIRQKLRNELRGISRGLEGRFYQPKVTAKGHKWH